MNNKIYVGTMDNGSGDDIIHCISVDKDKVLKHLQKEFLAWRGDYINERDVDDISSPTLKEMSTYLGGEIEIYELDDGMELYEQLRDYEFKGARRLSKNEEKEK